MYTAEQQELLERLESNNITISDQTHRILTKAIINGTESELTFGNLDQIVADDNANQEKVFAIRAELEEMALHEPTETSNDLFASLMSRWGHLDVISLIEFLDEISTDETPE